MPVLFQKKVYLCSTLSMLKNQDISFEIVMISHRTPLYLTMPLELIYTCRMLDNDRVYTIKLAYRIKKYYALTKHLVSLIMLHYNTDTEEDTR